MDAIYTAVATATHGREGRAVSSDGKVDLPLAMPVELGGNGAGTNPEQLFAAGYGACFDSALRLVARREKIDLGADAEMTAEVGLIRLEGGRFGLTVVLTGHFPALTNDVARTLMRAAHEICPYSNATRGNIPVELRLTGQDGVSQVVDASTLDRAA